MVSQKYLLKWVLPILIINGLIFQGTASAEVTVCDSGCDYTKIQDAIDVASNDETVRIGKGVFTENLTITDKSLNLIGSGSKHTIIDGSSLDDGLRMIDIQCNSNYQIVIKDVTITGGHLRYGFGGGGIINSGCTVILKKSTVTVNSARAGGGIINSSGIFKVIDSSIINNVAVDLGGGGIGNDGSLEVIKSVITNNQARSGGGGIDSGGILFVTKSNIDNNKARLGGGIAVTTSSEKATIIKSTISNNEASQKGGGILNLEALALEKSVVTLNKAGTLGGGIYTSYDLTLSDSIVSYNSAVGDGGGIFNDGIVTAVDTTIINNNPNNCAAGTGFICP